MPDCESTVSCVAIRDVRIAASKQLLQVWHVLLFLLETAVLPGEYLPWFQRYTFHKGAVHMPQRESSDAGDTMVYHPGLPRWYWATRNHHQVLASKG